MNIAGVDENAKAFSLQLKSNQRLKEKKNILVEKEDFFFMKNISGFCRKKAISLEKKIE